MTTSTMTAPTLTAPVVDSTSAAPRITRLLAQVLLGIGVVAAIAAAIWIQITRGSLPTEGEVYTMGAFRRGLLIFAHSSIGATAVPALVVAGLGGGVLLWLSRTRRWVFAAVAIAGV